MSGSVANFYNTLLLAGTRLQWTSRWFGRGEAYEVILHGMTRRVGAKGQVVIPKELRDELGIEPGDEVSFWREGDHLGVRPAGRMHLQGRFRGSRLTASLEADRRADREHDPIR